MTSMSAPAPPTDKELPDASMSLLNVLTDRSLDEGYAEAAARRPQGQPPKPGLLLAVGLLGVGLLLASAAAQVRSRQSAVDEAREALIDKITERSAGADRLADEVATLRAAVAEVRQNRLRASGSGVRLAEELAVLESWTGAAASVGPGVVVHLEDAQEPEQSKTGDPRAAPQSTDGRVTDRDLQTIVNEIWLAGAEAVAINGQRLTSLSAVRSAGPNILVGFRPLKPPYDIEAVGDPSAMRAALTDGFARSYLDVLRNYGIRSSVATKDKMTLPASAGITLRHATVAKPEAGT